jgi:hypothetical protein
MARELFNSKDHRGEDLVFLFIGARKSNNVGRPDRRDGASGSVGIGDNSDLYASDCSCLDRF